MFSKCGTSKFPLECRLKKSSRPGPTEETFENGTESRSGIADEAAFWNFGYSNIIFCESVDVYESIVIHKSIFSKPRKFFQLRGILVDSAVLNIFTINYFFIIRIDLIF
ncbi:uncharacterized protein GGS22DRAFT_189343 [Annulohypoxylon maeteangense]|uniref:uncharacterized protein n=1 Tax=Annulohypoxylon maeteangense TaxID=1927788 RepID=UPI002008C384|nr:uncharacterized protein GGS22DRAFT_189343 [Annulohypoxylon maeteangense]KAI0884213.1 hypothetical protein GGS22DRAFT_189343 [Annulohypoxylon maeteangense]